MHKVNSPSKTGLFTTNRVYKSGRKVLVQALAAITITSTLVPFSTAVHADETEKPGLFQRYSVNIQDLIIKGLEFVGVPYRRGGNTVESGLDCSGFTRLVFLDSNGIDLPRTAAEQAQVGTKVSAEELKPGDLVFFNTMKRAYSHVGIYLGNDQFVHAPKPGAEIRVENMHQAYWVGKYNGARRLDGVTAAPSKALSF
jgi:cell wall-associated NlpC family hydrolase